MEPSLERSIAERAASQLGHITDTQLLRLGVTAKARRRACEGSRLELVGTRTYRVGGLPPSFEADVMAACLDVGGVASHRTAAVLHGLAGFRRSDLPAIEVTVEEGRRRTRSPLALIHRTTNLPHGDIVRHGPIPTTNTARTLLGVAALVPEVAENELRNAIDTAVRDGLATDSWLWWHLERRRCKGRNGVVALEAALSDRAGKGRTESWLERTFLECIEEATLPLPIVQRRVRARGPFVARVDFLYPELALVIEVNGHGSHSTKRQRDADALRANELQLAGYSVLQFSYDQVVHQPAMVIATVARALARRAAA